MRLSGKVALVSGGRSGIGRAIAVRLQREGARVVTLQRGADPEFEGIEADLTDPAAADRAVAELVSRMDRLDILVNNAGMMREERIEQATLESWERTLAVNLTAPFLLIRAALPHLRAGGGAIVNVGSIEGMAANPGHAAYCASKAGLHGLTRAVAVDEGPGGVRCNAVAPGWIETELNRGMEGGEGFGEALVRLHPAGRTGRPEDVAAMVAFLASEDAAFITGQVYPVEGGRLAKLSLPDQGTP